MLVAYLFLAVAVTRGIYSSRHLLFADNLRKIRGSSLLRPPLTTPPSINTQHNDRRRTQLPPHAFSAQEKLKLCGHPAARLFLPRCTQKLHKGPSTKFTTNNIYHVQRSVAIVPSKAETNPSSQYSSTYEDPDQWRSVMCLTRNNPGLSCRRYC